MTPKNLEELKEMLGVKSLEGSAAALQNLLRWPQNLVQKHGENYIRDNRQLLLDQWDHRKAGVPESVIMEITGHSTREMFDRYNTVDEEDRREAIKKLEGFFRKASVNVDQMVDQTQILR